MKYDIPFVVYVRRSSEDKAKQVESIPAQLEWAREYAKQNEIKVIKTFQDKKSAKKPGREGFIEMMEFIKEQTVPVGVIVWKIDRLSRNPIDEAAIRWALMEKKIKHVLCSDRAYDEDVNQILFGVEFGYATQYSIELSKNVKRGMNHKVNMGWMPTLAPIGYKNDKYKLQGQKTISPDPDRFNLMKEAWRLLLTGQYTVPRIRRYLTEKGFTTLRGSKVSDSSLYSAFNKVFYAGYFEWNDELKKGAHMPMITLEDFDKAQILLGRKGAPRQGSHEHSYTGMIRCGECGCMITAEPPKVKTNKSGKVHVYHYMRCTKKNPKKKCCQAYIRLSELERQLDEILAHIEIPEAFVEWAFKILRREAKKDMSAISNVKAQLQKQLNQNEDMENTLLQKLLEQVIDDDAYKAGKKALKLEHERLSVELEGCSKDRLQRLNELEEKFVFAKTAREKFQKGCRETKRELVSKLGSNFVLLNKKLTINLGEELNWIEEGVSLTKAKVGSLEPLKKPLHKVEKGILESVIPVWSR